MKRLVAVVVVAMLGITVSVVMGELNAPMDGKEVRFRLGNYSSVYSIRPERQALHFEQYSTSVFKVRKELSELPNDLQQAIRSGSSDSIRFSRYSSAYQNYTAQSMRISKLREFRRTLGEYDKDAVLISNGYEVSKLIYPRYIEYQQSIKANSSERTALDLNTRKALVPFERDLRSSGRQLEQEQIAFRKRVDSGEKLSVAEVTKFF